LTKVVIDFAFDTVDLVQLELADGEAPPASQKRSGVM
jgi:hypothetical protein